jgi:hypothetical protein
MGFSRFICRLVAFVCFAALAFAGDTSNKAPNTQILPKEFGGWQMSSPEKTSTDPGVADPVNAGVLKEYGFNDFESAAYTRDDGRKLTLKAARFADASGAYGAFTYYKMPQMLIEKIGDQAASLNERVLLYRGNILIDAVFEKLSAMSAAELRELANDLPVPRGNTANLPGLPAYLPPQSYVKNSAKYIVGPEALTRLNAPIPAQLVGFDSGAEVELGNYNTSGGQATLTLIAYPTPQIAAAHLRAIEAAKEPSAASGGSSLLANVGPIFDKRTGPIVVLATGPLSPSEGKSLLAAVNYDANVTWNENTFFTKKDNLANLLINIIYLCAILIGLALVAGIAFGGLRILMKRLFPDRVFDRSTEVGFISLHLSEEIVETHAGEVIETVTESVSSSIKAI